MTPGFGLAFYFLIRLLESAPVKPWPDQPMVGQTMIILTALGMAAAMWRWHAKPWAYALLAHFFAIGFGIGVVWAWHGLQVGPDGVVSDAWFNTAMVIKHRAGMGNTDFAYRNLHGFYPSLYQAIVGKISALTHTRGPKAMNYGFYWAAFLLSLACYRLWRQLLPTLPAFLMMVVVMNMCREPLVFKTFEVASLVVFVPWALYYVVGIRLREVEGQHSWELGILSRREWIVGGLIAGLCFMTYYYYFFLLVPLLPLLVVAEFKSLGWRGLWDKYRPMGLMFLWMMAVSALYWLPLLTDMLRYGMHSYQNRWFTPDMVRLPFDYLVNWKGLLGLVVLLALAPTHKLARAVVLMLLALLMFVLLGHLGVYGNFPILHVRMLPVGEHLMHLGLIFGLLRILAHFPNFAQSVWEKGVAIVLALIYLVQVGAINDLDFRSESAFRAQTFKAPEFLNYPEFSELAKDKIFLTNQLEMIALRPIYLFICPNAHYTHPASRYRERLKMLVLLQQSHDPDFIAWMLRHNRYDRVDFVFLENGHLDCFDDNFPGEQNNIKVPIQFDMQALSGTYLVADRLFQEVKQVADVPLDLWHQFDRGELRLAALFTDHAEVQAQVPEAELNALRDEVRIRTTDYEVWKRVFASRWLE
jgi:hypothetical protein